MTDLAAPLPIDDALPALRAALAAHARARCWSPRPAPARRRASRWRCSTSPGRRASACSLLEPRRLAARAAAARMAATLGEKVGETIGLRVRLQSLVSARTRIEVVTEGVFTRMILDDPALEGVAAVLFDEFHERSLDADLGLALALDAQAALARGPAPSRHVGDARRRAGARAPRRRAADRKRGPRLSRRDPLCRARSARRGSRTRSRASTLEALVSETGSMLVFLPGQGEIRRVAEMLEARIRRPDVDIAPLYGAMDPARPGSRRRACAAGAAQDRARDLDRRDVADHRGRARRGRQRPHARAALRARHRPDAARDGARLARQRRPAARPRRPRRAGRLLPPVGGGGERRPSGPTPRRKSSRPTSPASCSTAPSGARPIRRGSPSSIRRRAARSPRRARCSASIGAIDAEGRITDEGRAIARLALPPRLARMVVDAARAGEARTAAEVAVVLTERGLGGDAVDLDDPARSLPPRPLAARRGRAAAGARTGAEGGEALTPGPSRRTTRLPTSGRGERPFSRLREKAAGESRTRSAPISRRRSSPPPIPTASPMARGKRGEFLMANGRAAALEPHERARRRAVSRDRRGRGRAASARILLAAPLTPRRDRGGRRRRDRDGGRARLRPRLRFAEGPPPPAARRARPRRADARRPAGRAKRARARARRPRARRSARLPWSKALTAMARPGHASCAAPRARPGRTSRTRASPKTRTGSRPFSSARRASTRSARTISPRRCAPCCRGTSRAGSTRRRRPISWRRPARPRRSTTRPRAARRSRCACRSCSASASTPPSPAGAFR